MKSLLCCALIGGSAILTAPSGLQAESTPAATTAAEIPADKLASGLKAGLGAIIKQSLGANQISVAAPSALAKIQSALSQSGKTEEASGFGDALSASVAQVAPQATELIQSSLKGLKFEDPQAVLSGGSDAATQFLQQKAGPVLREKLLPLVKQATTSTGLADQAKGMLAAAGPLAALTGNKVVSDLDGYLCDQVIAQSFAMIGKQEAAVRANPALLTENPLAQKVFAAFKKQ